MQEQIIQITSGQGPEECERVVAKVQELFLKEARAQQLHAEVLESVLGHLPGTLLSTLILVSGTQVSSFLARWVGTVQWVAQSPFRRYHKRKNWFVGVQAVNALQALAWNEQDVVYESMRASGPGGQHVNKTESAVRARHVPSGVTVVASERRSQHQNKAEARQRLQEKLRAWQVQQAAQLAKEQWQQHQALARGNAVRTFTARL
ncbi:peptide chain release factor H [Rufibacter quisquiliarum]|uniref:Peptide chain release factor n=1 Tax=Rufibacter quisquiliarum TaxID=1549639 RepID=A0A839GAM3_9BACT|nr:peptide chain release factor H [Rufibacter quisquiliarum]MBA9075340.1 peptide chain release factor [Rufibacter quisquiliarum]